MEEDKRHALGSGSGSNRLPMKYPFNYDEPRPPLPDYCGESNPAISDRRPIARLHPALGPGNIKAGVSFKTPMGEKYGS